MVPGLRAHAPRTHAGDGQGFYAVLDESTASLDVESEVAVYGEPAGTERTGAQE